VLSACPWLPQPGGVLGPEVTRELAGERGVAYYRAALCYAQSLWREGKPAQAILQLNKAFTARLAADAAVLGEWPAPYRALGWMLRERPDGVFLGNPVRHFQHLATRVRGLDRELRAWRAWGCFHLARRVLPEDGFPVDAEQVEREGLAFPEWDQVLAELGRRGWNGEVAALVGAVNEAPA
jgi:hypothetical protein